MNTARKVVAELASSLYAGRLSYDEFIGSLPSDCEGDEEVSQLVDLITHEPKPGGLFCISATDHEAYIADIRTRIETLKKAEPIKSITDQRASRVADC